MNNNALTARAIRNQLKYFFEEDDLARNIYYTSQLPMDAVIGSLFIKSDLVMAGLPYFLEAFKYLGELDLLDADKIVSDYEGKFCGASSTPLFSFKLPFAVALTAERIALNLVQHASSIATATNKFVQKAAQYNIAILDTRKTLPGLRALEKYAVRVGGGYNHRLGQTDLWMVKDNHKNFFGGVTGALSFFKKMHGFYVPIEVEIHSLSELKDALDLQVKHLMLDNFSLEDIKKAIAQKPKGVTYELSGGVNWANFEKYLIPGVDAISIGAITYGASSVDISFKYKKC
ncbi:MAG: nicotinate-nucleotide diphosphorylase (carboxylating) [Bdellovibrionales bacterium RIFOXYD12_FULL_39_22]|nr:MAG: nicotinate-nucleotide diphosphorylase (carboxylating) [Bdellovibrionales bacterium RIFOXYB1_FULL_39_21]OFZ45289.1 MAG: nicotinate-nucleotide diphosphorylase (carboxylating) [Bdellovibrionales bacterium RIFOXYC12_FULL_39_17]OFZ45521.1 MAG: nicotinate-nucleotide diphosphorylase (carboxylating) [Bdellovibrionales bacterium RIFOXYC1_FULL_39_130]OFZ75036.1 MAG: nicotinate-nucleotide diphosphorylase (carboxylating) [Bdellovibrionales bacterium RIFOXYC2_FULL_39_8]OFZ77382.1 MAG: nicotinate-nuc